MHSKDMCIIGVKICQTFCETTGDERKREAGMFLKYKPFFFISKILRSEFIYSAAGRC